MREVGPNLGMPFTRALEKGIFEVRAKGVRRRQEVVQIRRRKVEQIFFRGV